MAEGRIVLGDLPDHLLQALRNGHSRAAGGRRGLPVATTETDRLSELPFERVDLGLQQRRAAGVVETLGLLELLAQIAQTTPVCFARDAVEHGTGPAAHPRATRAIGAGLAGRRDRDEI